MTTATFTSLTYPAALLKAAVNHVIKTGASRGKVDERSVKLHCQPGERPGDGGELRLTSRVMFGNGVAYYQLTACLPHHFDLPAPVSTTLPIHFLDAALTGNVDGQSVTISASDESTTITRGDASFTLRGLVDELQTVDIERTEPLAYIDDPAWHKTIRAAATDDSRPVLAGVHAFERDGRLYLEATDGFRMAYYKGPPLDRECAGFDQIIPIHVLKQLPTGAALAICAPGEDTAVLRYEIEHGIEIIAQVATIPGTYPNLSEIIPAWDTEVAIPAQHIHEAAALYKHNIGEAVVLTAGGLKLKTSWGHVHWAFNPGEIVSEYAFNGAYLSWAARDTDTLTGYLGEPNAPAVIKHGDLTMLVMPMILGGN